MIEVIAGCKSEGREVYDDEIARAAYLGGDRYLLECGGYSVEFDVALIAEAMLALRRKVAGASPLMAAAQAILGDVEDRLPADPAEEA
jgi:hypothetical protein